MKMYVACCLMVCASLGAQRAPSPTDLAGHPFYIKKNWILGGSGSWDYLTMDPTAGQLFIAHGPAVQVVNAATGTLAGTINGLREAHAIALDSEGAFGYITDGPAAQVRIFDRRSLQVVASVPTGPMPRAIVFEPQTRLVFVIGAQPVSEELVRAADGTLPRRRANPKTSRGRAESTVTVVDSESRKQLAQVVLSGRLGFAEADGNGRIFVAVADSNQIVRLDAEAIGSTLRGLLDAAGAVPSKGSATENPAAAILDWTSDAQPLPPAESRPRFFTLGSGCQEPRALAVDAAHLRLFAACTNQKMIVLNADTGEAVSSVPIGPGADAVGYDSDRGLIFSANGGGDGSLTVIRQNVTDTYSVIQILPTRQRARTLAINSSTGEVYLATAIYGFPLDRPPVNGVGTLKMNSVDSSFQVLVVGN
jgi:DNA-binding beta-propeller fold protein YncE